MRIALHTHVKADRIAEYEAAHREVPAALSQAFRDCGVTEWTIWRSGTDLFHLLECPDLDLLQRHLVDLPVNVAWQTRITELLDAGYDHTSLGPLPVVWEL